MSPLNLSAENYRSPLIEHQTALFHTFHETLTSIFHESSEEYALLSNSPALATLGNAITNAEFALATEPLLDLYKRVLKINHPWFYLAFKWDRLEGISTPEAKKARLCESVSWIMSFMKPQLNDIMANRAIGLRLALSLLKVECYFSKEPLEVFIGTLAVRRQKDWVFTLLKTQKAILVNPKVIGSLVNAFCGTVHERPDYESINLAFAQLEYREDREEVLDYIGSQQSADTLAEITTNLKKADLL